MEIYLVGGAVRDTLLGLPVTERDWVVVGATPEEMLKLGYQAVGKDFPVFLHPKTHEEYALARTERKTGKGYKGFTFYCAPDVSLIADLERRDLTINAIAQAPDGKIIDPYAGQADLKQRLLRHVSPAFQEDPVRILRVARFSARFSDFSVHPDTLKLMRHMVDNGEVNALVAERVWQEFNRALQTTAPERFLTILSECGALPVLFPEIKLSAAILAALAHAIEMTDSPIIRFAVLLHTLDEKSVLQFCDRYRIPKEYADLAQLTARWWKTYRNLNKSTPAQEIFILLKSLDARRRPERFQQFLSAANACIGAKKPPAEKRLLACAHAMQQIDIQPLQEQALKGQAFSQALEKLQLAAIEKTISYI